VSKKIHRLSALAVAKATKPGLYADGAGLCLRVGRSGAKHWVLRYMLHGTAREMGLGGFRKVSLADARQKAAEAQRLLADRVDPLVVKAERLVAAKLQAARGVTFDNAAAGYLQAHQGSWKNGKHCQQWRNTLATLVSPVFGSLPVSEINTALVLKALEPIWTKVPETASRLRGRIEQILDWAKARGYRAGENPARWRGHLDKLLPARSKILKTKPHAAMPYAEIPEFIAKLRKRDGAAARALEFAVLTAARSGEVLNARWGEFDLNGAIWTVPAERMKAGKEYRVPLSPRALKIIKDMAHHQNSKFVFCNQPDGSLSEKALYKTLRRMKVESATPHGFRSAFRDWAAERTNFQNHVVEMALAHTIGDKVEAAYRRGDLFDKRRRLMQQWATFCTTAPTRRESNVTALRSLTSA
jgi:integrase